ncbi:hypothetical protein [Colwellia sp. Bg11-12]|uniref:hypothetical protein n=1 Tax=Colwellia sp. Bg11-12 TaxID=2759817 RepID=UPI0015F3E9B7|nr:hypothetical protein [Colwellia sp. Bg11-12]MBA6264271.1 hypothetical protein [Colwellia sp. Bg11-12]
MNRQKQEELKNFRNDTKGMSPSEIEKYKLNLAEDKERQNHIHFLHVAIFPEEYSYQGDSYSATKKRKRGINPLSEIYIKTVDERRLKLGVEPYICNQEHYQSTKDYCLQKAINLSNDEIKALTNEVKKEYQNNNPASVTLSSKPMTEAEEDMHMWLS